MRRRIVCTALMLALGGAVACRDGGTPEAPEAASKEAPSPAQPSPPAPRTGPTEVEMVASMEAHYNVVILAHDALLRGDLDRFASQLALVSEQALPESAPAQWRPFYAQMQAAASQGVDARDLDAAARALASVVLSCGTCHAALGKGPVYPAPAPEEGAHPVQTAMRDHKWATERLWEGVTGPWDGAWQRGADALATGDVFGEAQPELVVSDELLRRGQELREIGEAARGATALDERAALYGRLLATCGGCHQLIGVTPPAPN